MASRNSGQGKTNQKKKKKTGWLAGWLIETTSSPYLFFVFFFFSCTDPWLCCFSLDRVLDAVFSFFVIKNFVVRAL